MILALHCCNATNEGLLLYALQSVLLDRTSLYVNRMFQPHLPGVCSVRTHAGSNWGKNVLAVFSCLFLDLLLSVLMLLHYSRLCWK